MFAALNMAINEDAHAPKDSAPDAVAVESASTTATKTLRRKPSIGSGEARTLIHNFCKLHGSRNHTTKDLEALLQQIQKIPRFAGYTMERLRQHLVNKRNRKLRLKADAAQAQSSPVETYGLDATSISTLDHLMNAMHEAPNKDDISSWASLLRVPIYAVEAYVSARGVGTLHLSYQVSSSPEEQHIHPDLSGETLVGLGGTEDCDTPKASGDVVPFESNVLTSGPAPFAELMQPIFNKQLLAHPVLPDPSDYFASAFAPSERSARANSVLAISPVKSLALDDWAFIFRK